MKVVINRCYGGFGLSSKALTRYCELSNIVNPEDFYVWDIERTDPILIQIVEEMGEDADDAYSKLKIIEIADDVKWHIEEYDGIEHIAEDHRTWVK